MATSIKTNSMENIIKCGITIEPPMVIVYYTIEDKIRKKKMPLRQFKPSSNCTFLADELKRRHQLNLPQAKIYRLLRILQEMLNGCTRKEALERVENEIGLKSQGNLNKLTTQELQLRKQEMDVLFTKNQVKKGQPNFEYDKQVEFTQSKTDSPWDQDDQQQEDFWETSNL